LEGVRRKHLVGVVGDRIALPRGRVGQEITVERDLNRAVRRDLVRRRIDVRRQDPNLRTVRILVVLRVFDVAGNRDQGRRERGTQRQTRADSQLSAYMTSCSFIT
jgi:hypothetical protein